MIVGYTALLDPVAMGHAFEVLVNVDLHHKDRDTVERFEAEVAALDEVTEVRRMFGLPDYVVRVGTPDLESFEAFVTAGLGAVPGIAKVDSHLTMKVVKSQTVRSDHKPWDPGEERGSSQGQSDEERCDQLLAAAGAIRWTRAP